MKLNENARQVMCKRYFHKGEQYPPCEDCGENHETDEQFLSRISFHKPEYWEMLNRLDFLPNSPTLFNAGTGAGTSSACFKFDVKDSMLDDFDDSGHVIPSGSIMDVAYKAAAVQKWGGGVGYYFGNLRSKGTPIRSTHGRACGPIAVMKHYHSIAEMITQGGKREGAQMGILDCYHPDVREFIHCKDDNPDELSTFNISVACTDQFMQQVINNPSSEEHELFWEMAESAWRTGDPGCYFPDTSERTNPTPWLGGLTGTNPCGEVPLLDNEPCNLGSINLLNFVDGDRFDFSRLREVAKLATRYLDDVLDQNTFPHPDIDKIARTTRKLGLGVMGWADALAILHIDYDSQEAVDLGRKVMHTIDQAAFEESVNLAREKGPNPAFLEHYGQDAHYMPRNATRTCIAPTGSISLLAGVSSGIEPHYSRTWTRYLGDGTPLKESIWVLEQCAPFIPKTSDEVSWEWHVRHQGAFQEHTNLAVSKTINMPNSATKEDIYKAYILMWELGCKGGTIYRDGSRSRQVLESDKTLEARDGHTHPPSLVPYRKKMPKRAETIRWGFSLAGIQGFIHAGKYDDGELGEIFLTFGKDGSTIAGLMDALAISMSLGLQHGVPLETYVSHFESRRFEPYGMTDDPNVRTATSVVDYLARWLAHEFLNGNHKPEEFTGMVCDDCGAPAVHQEGCLYCSAGCGWSRC